MRSLNFVMAAISTFVSCSLGGCVAPAIQDMTCDFVEAEVVAVSTQVGSGPGLIKILNGKLVSQNNERIVCVGDGVYDDRSHMETRYQAYVDSEGEIMVEYDTDAYLEREAENLQNDFQASIDQAQREAEQQIYKIQRQLEASY